MTYQISIECDNDSFFTPDGKHDPCAEVASILEQLCLRHLREGSETETPLYDTNGNRVGQACFVA